MLKKISSEEIEKQVIERIPEQVLIPKSVEDVVKLPPFLNVIKAYENHYQAKFAEMDFDLQQALVLRRLRQLYHIVQLNPLWKERIEKAGITKAPESFKEWQELPLSDKNSMNYFFSGDRPGMVVPLEYNGFEIVASGGTSSGLPSETVYSIKELHDTYKLAGDFIGRYQLKPFLVDNEPKWVMTTLADYQLWSSGTMVGGVLQNIPGINYLGAGPVMKDVYQHIMKYKGSKAIMGITQGIAILADLGIGLPEEARKSLRVAMYGSGALSQRHRNELKEIYPNLTILSYFAATQAETIGLQLDPEVPYLAAVPGLHFIEIVDENGHWVPEGEEGELVITRLLANEAPIIRFKLGDRMIRRPNIETSALKTQQFEFFGRSGEIIHLCDTQYPAAKVFQYLCDTLKSRYLIDLNTLAHEMQLTNHRNAKTLTLLVSVDDVSGLTCKTEYFLGREGTKQLFIEALMHALSIFNQGEANPYSVEKYGYQFALRFVGKNSPEIFRTNLGKTPLLKDIL